MRSNRLITAFAVAGGLVMGLGSANAASDIQKECSAKYQAAKAANQLNGMDYRAYYKQCSAEAKAEKAGTAKPTATPAAAPAAAPAPATTPAAPATTAAAPAAPAAVAPKKTAAAPANIGNAVLPTAIAPSFASQKPHLARLHTCAAQWKANKASNANGTLKWPAYYSACNARLKG